MDERLRFIARLLDGEQMAGLCPVFTSLGSGAEAIQEGADVDEADAHTC